MIERQLPPQDPPPIYNPPVGQDCESCAFGITRSFGTDPDIKVVLECRANPPNIFQGYLARWPQVQMTDWCKEWSAKPAARTEGGPNA